MLRLPRLAVLAPLEDVSRWHVPGATSAERARDVARTCWKALRSVDPDAADRIAWAATQAGETWLTPQVARYQDDDFVSPADAAELIGKSARTVYEWVARGWLPHIIVHDGRSDRIRVRVGTVLDVAANRRRSKADD